MDNQHYKWDPDRVYGPAEGPNQINLVERWQKGEIIGEPKVVKRFIEAVLEPCGDAHVKVIAVFPMADAVKRWLPLLSSGAVPGACFPCAWPGLLILSPCITYNFLLYKRTYENMHYVVTDAGLYTFVADFNEPCCGCCLSSGTDSQKIVWGAVFNPAVNNAGRGCGPCRITNSVTLGGAGEWYVDIPNEVLRFVKAVQTHYFGAPAILGGTGGMGGMMGGMMGGTGDQPQMQNMQQMQAMFAQQPQLQATMNAASAPPVATRIFVAHNGGQHHIVKVNTNAASMIEVLHAVADALKVPFSADLHLEMEGVGATVTAPGDIQADDKFVLITSPPAYTSK